MLRPPGSPLLLLALAACGIPDGKALTALEAEDRSALCEEYAPREVTCPTETGDQTWAFGSDCEETTIAASCPATAGDYRDCAEAFAAASEPELCEGLPPECDRFFSVECVAP